MNPDAISLEGLSAAKLRDLAGSTSFQRGRDYVEDVTLTHLEHGSANAIVEGSDDYEVLIAWNTGGVVGDCSCPWSEQGFFCKHIVALGLAILESDQTLVPTHDSTHHDSTNGEVANDSHQEPTIPTIESWIRSLDDDEVLGLIYELAAASPEGWQLLTDRASAAEHPHTGPAPRGARTATSTAEQFLEEAAIAIDDTVDEDWNGRTMSNSKALHFMFDLERRLEAGDTNTATAMIPALEYAIEELRDLESDVYDRGDNLASALYQAHTLHAAACAKGDPDPMRLADWWVAELQTEAWSYEPLSKFTSTLTPEAREVCRVGAEAYLEALGESGDYRGARARDGLIDLADADGDIDRAIEILSQGRTKWAAIVDRLQAAGRTDDALTWIDRAVREGGVGPGHLDLPVESVCEAYLDADRAGDAMTLLRDRFAGHPHLTEYKQLLNFAGQLGLRDQEHTWATKHAEKYAARHKTGALPITLAVTDGDIDRAWSYADRWGAGDAWQTLLAHGADLRPQDAADLYRPWLTSALPIASTNLYPRVAEALQDMRRLYALAGSSDQLDEEIRQIREDYKRRPRFIKELNRLRLPK